MREIQRWIARENVTDRVTVRKWEIEKTWAWEKERETQIVRDRGIRKKEKKRRRGNVCMERLYEIH